MVRLTPKDHPERKVPVPHLQIDDCRNDHIDSKPTTHTRRPTGTQVHKTRMTHPSCACSSFTEKNDRLLPYFSVVTMASPQKGRSLWKLPSLSDVLLGISKFPPTLRSKRRPLCFRETRDALIARQPELPWGDATTYTPSRGGTKTDKGDEMM